LNVRNAGKLISGASLVLDGTDNDATRYLINAACLRQGIPWIFAAVLESYGLIMNIVPEKTPCFACVFGRPQQHSARNDEKGALATVTHMVASLQVSQALRLLLGDGAYNRGLVYVDALGPALETVEVKTPSEGCSACDRRRGNRSV
jgi:adenylyltransferase/sulfurtransferase